MSVSQKRVTDLTGAMMGRLVANQKLFEKILSHKDMQWAYENPRDAISVACKSIRGRNKPVPKKSSREDVIVDTIIRVDRTISDKGLRYISYKRELIFSDIIHTGPVEYDINDIEEWRHDGQSIEAIDGETILNFIKKYDNPQQYLGLADLIAIKKKGPEFFRKYFGGKKAFGWKSTFEIDPSEKHSYPRRVPYLHLTKGGLGSTLMLDWKCTAGLFDMNCVALRFKNDSFAI